MRRISFPLGGRLRASELLRTTYVDGTVSIRYAKDLAAHHLLELATEDWKLDCVQEVWDMSGNGVFAAKVDGTPSLLISENQAGVREYKVFQMPSEKFVMIDPLRGEKLLHGLLERQTHTMLSFQEYLDVRTTLLRAAAKNLEEVRNAKRQKAVKPMRGSSSGPLRRPATQPSMPTDDDDFDFAPESQN